MCHVDQRAETAQFLRTRRARITPEQAGLIAGGGYRRVPGLRREEVALLAGVSVDYYARMERGNLAGVSADVLGSLARALMLDEAETAHLQALAHAAGPQSRRRTRPGTRAVRPGLQRLLDAITDAPAWIRDTRMDVIAVNALGGALCSPVLDNPANRRNNARFVFLDPAARSYYPEWDKGADDIVATLRGYAAQSPLDSGLTDLIGELVTRSDDFRARWAAHNVRHHRTGLKRLHHPAVGDLELSYEALGLPTDPDWTMFVFTAESGSVSEERLRLLGSLAATGAAGR